MQMVEAILFSGNENKVSNMVKVLAKFGITIDRYAEKKTAPYKQLIDYGPDVDKVFRELSTDGTCRWCHTSTKIHIYLNECKPCMMSQARRKTFGATI